MSASLPRHLLKHGARWKAPYATGPEEGGARVHEETEDPLRSPFQRDRDRIVHCTAFRRLKHKTQVFIRPEGDHFRTRLTHSLEVAQVARSIARPLGLDEDLTEAIALAHDLGHTPFGHAGERALSAALGEYGGFDHNVQSLRVVTRLERRYARYDGLNLSRASLEGLVKHNGPLKGKVSALSPVVMELNEALDLDLENYAGAEAQIAAISDDIAYDAHDIDDGLRSGLLHPEDLVEVPLTARIIGALDRTFPALERSRFAAELTRRLITVMIIDVLVETAGRLEGAASMRAVTHAGEPTVGFSQNMAREEKELKGFLFSRLYRHESVMLAAHAGEAIVTDLFERLHSEPEFLPDEWQAELDMSDKRRRARRAADYIAGMSDGFAVAEHRRLFDHTPDLG
ncbi:deoxyguanosinetriphosphate triphosphohydrolase [Afifella aestuarii]|uniref:deoxyguanosinetriphosphate triphosphohydrolase n=1 Tax=Afifella aestuarii TaxID=1909496 RepID=UPI000FE411E9|nr:deoxyguanosinetriphosphate triphosphohydrolase [Afifella aestuarii]